VIVPQGKVVDLIDNVLRNDTPEEYVRQEIEKAPLRTYRYPHRRPRRSVSTNARLHYRSYEQAILHTQETIERFPSLGSSLLEPQSYPRSAAIEHSERIPLVACR
jgi:hypothetical protein